MIEERNLGITGNKRTDLRPQIQARFRKAETTLNATYLREIVVAQGEIFPRGETILRGLLDFRIREEIVRTSTFYSAMKRRYGDCAVALIDHVWDLGAYPYRNDRPCKTEVRDGLFLAYQPIEKFRPHHLPIGSWSLYKSDQQLRVRIEQDLGGIRNG